MSENIDLLIRQATPEDHQNIYDLSNEETVKENIISPQNLTKESHKKWLEKILNDKNYLLQIASDSNHNFIGQVFYEIESIKSYITISIKEEYRGLDLAAPIIIKSAKILFESKKEVESIHAYIKETNIPSLKAFEQAGYLYYKQEIIENTKFYIYRYLRN